MMIEFVDETYLKWIEYVENSLGVYFLDKNLLLFYNICFAKAGIILDCEQK